MSERTLTDNRALETLLDERWCHVEGLRGGSMCGCAGERDSHMHFGYWKPNGRCTGCGRRWCPDCSRMSGWGA